MSLLRKIFSRSPDQDQVDYYEEALALSVEGKYHEALTSLRLVLRDNPGDRIVLQQIAIIYTRIGQGQEAIKTYRHVLQRHPDEPGAHYGLAFLLLKQGDEDEAIEHLEAFLDAPPSEEDAGEHIAYARKMLAELSPKAEADEDAVAAGSGTAEEEDSAHEATP